jgi:hypothetical protein
MSPPTTTNPLKRKLLFALKASKKQKSLSASLSVLDSRLKDTSLESIGGRGRGGIGLHQSLDSSL